MNNISKNIGDRELKIETGKIARQADASVIVQYGETVVLVTCVMSSNIREDINFLPLTVEYREKTYAAGKIPGGFFKREGRPSEKEILSSRLIDRPIRSLFPEGMVNDIQVMATVLSSDGLNNPDLLAVNGASFALSISHIPYEGFVGCVRVGKVDGNLIINPTYKQLENSSMDLVIAASRDGIVMLEGGMDEVPEEEVEEAIKFSMPYIDQIIQMQQDFVDICGREKKEVQLNVLSEELLETVRNKALKEIEDSYNITSKEKRVETIENIVKRLVEELSSEDSQYSEGCIRDAVSSIQKQDIRKRIIDGQKRIDGRNLDELRNIECEVGILPRTHGSGLFTRGETQSLVAATLGTRSDEQIIDALEGESYKKFMLHYNFPPFSVGEVRPARGPGRREVGHGALAERALDFVMPSEKDFPYTVRVVSDILESNGSSSMATVCGASLSLMDAGVPIKAAVAGVALGLVKVNDKEVILTDIIGLEDHLGDMDFKSAGTRKGITAIQLDVKLRGGVSYNILKNSLIESRKTRNIILDKMDQVISKPRENISPFAPHITTLKIDPKKIGSLIGPGGKTIRKIIEQTESTIDINDEEAMVSIAANSKENINKAIQMIKDLTEDVEVGKIYEGKITKTTNFGAFCEVLPNKEGLIHISELSKDYIKSVEDAVKIGDKVKVKVLKIDEMGRVNLSVKKVEEENQS